MLVGVLLAILRGRETRTTSSAVAGTLNRNGSS
jgi:hypothetical protein